MSKQGCKTLRKMFVFMALFPPLRTPNLRPGSPNLRSPSLHPGPPRASPCLASSRNPLFLPRRFFFTSSCRRFPECAAWRGGSSGGGRSYFSCFSLLLSLRGAAPPRVFPRLTSPSPSLFLSMSFTLPYYLQSRSLPQTTSPHYRQPPTRRREFPPPLRRHFNVTLIKSNNQYLPRKKF